MGTIREMSDKRCKILDAMGFTLIEMLIVISIVALTIPVIFALFYNLIFAQTKLIHLTEVKRQGDFALTYIEGKIQNNAQEIHNLSSGCSNWINLGVGNTACAAGGSSFNSTQQGADFCLVDKNGQGFNFFLNNSGGSKITYAAQSGATDDLTSSNVVISNFTISCSRNSTYSPSLVTVNFNISYSGVGIGITRPEDIASMLYQTSFQLKNY